MDKAILAAKLDKVLLRAKFEQPTDVGGIERILGIERTLEELEAKNIDVSNYSPLELVACIHMTSIVSHFNEYSKNREEMREALTEKVINEVTNEKWLAYKVADFDYRSAGKFKAQFFSLGEDENQAWVREDGSIDIDLFKEALKKSLEESMGKIINANFEKKRVTRGVWVADSLLSGKSDGTPAEFAERYAERAKDDFSLIKVKVPWKQKGNKARTRQCIEELKPRITTDLAVMLLFNHRAPEKLPPHIRFLILNPAVAEEKVTENSDIAKPDSKISAPQAQQAIHFATKKEKQEWDDHPLRKQDREERRQAKAR